MQHSVLRIAQEAAGAVAGRHGPDHPVAGVGGGATSAFADLRNYTTNDIFVRVKPLAFLGDSLDVLRAFPYGARRAAGFQSDRLQRGLEPLDWKPMTSIGPGGDCQN
jgi:hypothetical protein